MKLFATLAASVLAALSLNLYADDEMEISDFSFDNIVQGDKPSNSALKGKVVVLEYWGVNCPPCIASMPHLAQMDKKLRKKGLVIIGSEVQGSSEEKIKKIIDQAKIKFTITRGVQGPAKVTGIPAALVFDVSGKKIYQGSPSDSAFERTIKKALKEVKLEDDQDNDEQRVRKTNAPLIPQRQWTNSEGKKITASVTAADGQEVTFKLYNSKVVKYQLNKLSEADQEIIALAVETAEEANKTEPAEE